MQCKVCGHDNPGGAQFCQKCGASLFSAVEPSAISPNTISVPLHEVVAPLFAGFWIRFLAALIDALIVYTVIGTVTFIVRIFPMAVVFNSFIAFLFLFTYLWLFTGLRGQTVGKMALRIKVVDQQGNIPGLGRAFLREVIGKFASYIALLFGFIWIAFDKDKRGWHDIIAGTHVVSTKPR